MTEHKRRIIPPVYLLLSLIAQGVLHLYVPIAQVIQGPNRLIGAFFVSGGALMTLLAAGAFRAAGTAVMPFERPTTLVTGGLFRFTRNPMYLGMAVFLLGIAILLGSLSAFFPIPVFIAIIQEWFIKGEERFLEEIFGEQYLGFKNRVRRWF